MDVYLIFHASLEGSSCSFGVCWAAWEFQTPYPDSHRYLWMAFGEFRGRSFSTLPKGLCLMALGKRGPSSKRSEISFFRPKCNFADSPSIPQGVDWKPGCWPSNAAAQPGGSDALRLVGRWPRSRPRPWPGPCPRSQPRPWA